MSDGNKCQVVVSHGMHNWMKCICETLFDMLWTTVMRSWHFMWKPHCRSFYPCLWRMILALRSCGSHLVTCPTKWGGSSAPWEKFGELRNQEDLTSAQKQSLKVERPVSVTIARNFPSVHRNKGSFSNMPGLPPASPACLFVLYLPSFLPNLLVLAAYFPAPLVSFAYTVICHSFMSKW